MSIETQKAHFEDMLSKTKKRIKEYRQKISKIRKDGKDPKVLQAKLNLELYEKHKYEDKIKACNQLIRRKK